MLPVKNMDEIYILTAYMGVPPNLSKNRGYGYANVSSSLPIYTCMQYTISKINFRSTDVLHSAEG